ncbi:MAG: adenylate/guanylate cyclase domain-containing protein [Leptolyngbyaceae cyanobacterium bins.59]|nr:adenylate/guanylate cyclase domain-containing protein [Leptolyngbyaceae cyanobacterium bins.59]
MKAVLFSSIRGRIMISTTLLIVTIVGGLIASRVRDENEFYREQKQTQLRSMASILARTLEVEIQEQNWGNIQFRLDQLLRDNEDVVYAVVSDLELNNQMVAAVPSELREQFIPDVVPLAISRSVTRPNPDPRFSNTVLLRDILFPEKEKRGNRGEEIIEIAYDIQSNRYTPTGEHERPTRAIVRIGVTVRRLNEAIAAAIYRTLAIGAVGLAVGLAGAYLLARYLSEPIVKLRDSAEKLAAGELNHQAEIALGDEIGALANAFNDMSQSLKFTFDKLQRTLDSFERFVPEKFLQAIAPQGIENIRVGQSSIRTVTILFADIRGYTSISEKLTPQEIFDFLNRYLACMGAAIDQTGGFIDKYIGDAIMALFDDEYADSALQAAVKMQEALVEFNRDRHLTGFPEVAIGIGLHRGQVVMGTVGFTSRMDSTVIGDAVNVASRVEGLTKYYDCKILMTDSVVDALARPEAVKLKLVDTGVKVKGKESMVNLYKLDVSHLIKQPVSL